MSRPVTKILVSGNRLGDKGATILCDTVAVSRYMYMCMHMHMYMHMYMHM